MQENKQFNQELKKRVYVKDIKEIFNLQQVSGDEQSLQRWAIAPDINRPGLELSGYTAQTELKRVVVIGNKEQDYIKTLDYDTQVERFNFLTDAYTPCIIVSANRKCPEALKEVANKKNFPVFEYADQTYTLTTELTSYLAERLAQVEILHGEMLNIYGKGVLVEGDSGVGKSELAMDLIKRGHMLVADDVVEYSRVHNNIVCWAPNNIKKMLEVRGIGIIDITLMYGAQCYLEKSELDLIIKLVTPEEYRESSASRLEPNLNYESLFDIKKKVLEIPVTEGKTMSPIIEAAVTNHILCERGIDTNEMFKENIFKEIMKKNEVK